MNKGWYTTHRVIGSIMNVIGYFWLFMSVALIFELGIDKNLILYLFASACMVIYCVLSRLMLHVVIREQKPMRRSLKDWIIANALGMMAGFVYVIVQGFIELSDKAFVRFTLDSEDKLMHQYFGSTAPPATFGGLAAATVLRSLLIGIGIAHGIWTLVLVNRNKAAFQ